MSAFTPEVIQEATMLVAKKHGMTALALKRRVLRAAREFPSEAWPEWVRDALAKAKRV